MYRRFLNKWRWQGRLWAEITIVSLRRKHVKELLAWLRQRKYLYHGQRACAFPQEHSTNVRRHKAHLSWSYATFSIIRKRSYVHVRKSTTLNFDKRWPMSHYPRLILKVGVSGMGCGVEVGSPVSGFWPGVGALIIIWTRLRLRALSVSSGLSSNLFYN